MSQPHAILAEYDTPADIMAAAKDAGADAAKLQTYTADTLTINDDIKQNRRTGNIVIPYAVVDKLVMPFAFPRIKINGQKGFGE